jgi:hypothetical protein
MHNADYYPEHNGLDILWDDAKVIELLTEAIWSLAREHYAPPTQADVLV